MSFYHYCFSSIPEQTPHCGENAAQMLDAIPPFDPEEAFISSHADWDCDLCRHWQARKCRSDDPQHCPGVLKKAYAYLTDYITPEELEELLRFSLGDDLLAAELARRAGLDLIDGTRLFDAFQFWAKGLRK